MNIPEKITAALAGLSYRGIPVPVRHLKHIRDAPAFVVIALLSQRGDFYSDDEEETTESVYIVDLFANGELAAKRRRETSPILPLLYRNGWDAV